LKNAVNALFTMEFDLIGLDGNGLHALGALVHA
jgi:hypothetical protein